MRIRTGLSSAGTGDLVFNCQMGRGRTTTGMVTACLISTTLNWNKSNTALVLESGREEEGEEDGYDTIDGPSEEDAYLQGGLHDILDVIIGLCSRLFRLQENIRSSFSSSAFFHTGE